MTVVVVIGWSRVKQSPSQAQAQAPTDLFDHMAELLNLRHHRLLAMLGTKRLRATVRVRVRVRVWVRERFMVRFRNMVKVRIKVWVACRVKVRARGSEAS